jgi:transposase InsO family protein
MIVTLHTDHLTSLEQIERFLHGTTEIDFRAPDRAARRAWIERVLRQFRYAQRVRRERGLLLRFLTKVTGYSPAQMKRLIKQLRTEHHLRDRRGPPAQPFVRRYTLADQQALAELDALHHTLSGPATRKLAERALFLFGDTRYQRLAAISVAHLYNLRRATGYQRARGALPHKTQSVNRAIGERRAPQPNGLPGFIRVDSVHQGDLDGIKGVYLINTVDSLTQFQFIAAVERISEHYLLPVLHALLERFPFVLRGFHADNGSEYINHQVAALLTKLNIELTKSRPRHSNDNGLAETKNGWVIRKHIGYGHIASRHAEAFQQFYREHFNPYLNFHRPCGIPELRTLARGKIKRVYRRWETPWDILRGLDDWETTLRTATSAAVQTRGRASPLLWS